VPIRRNPREIYLVLGLYADGFEEVEKGKRLDGAWNPVVGNPGKNWHELVELSMVHAASGREFSGNTLQITWYKVDRAAAGKKLRLVRATRLWGLDAYAEGVTGIARVKLVSGAPFPDGDLKTSVKFDSTKEAGFARLSLADSVRIGVKAAVTALELLEAKLQRANIRRIVFGDTAAEIRLLREILATRPNSAFPLRQLALAYNMQKDRVNALKFARKYQRVYEARLDPAWFTERDFKDTLWGSQFWSLRRLIFRLENYK